MREDILDQQASLQRARLEASLADGISWGMGEDAIMEEAEVCVILASLDRSFLKMSFMSCYNSLSITGLFSFLLMN